MPAEEVSKLPAALERDRKVGLYKTAITLFEKGKFWEEAINVMDALASQYKNFDFDYIQLAELLKQEASFYQNISTVERIYHEYFRVGFYGKGFGEYAVSTRIFPYLEVDQAIAKTSFLEQRVHLQGQHVGET